MKIVSILIAAACAASTCAGGAPDLRTKALTPVRFEKAADHAPLVFVKDGRINFDIVFDHSATKRSVYDRADTAEILTQSCARVFGAVPPLRRPDEPSSRLRLLVKDSGADQAFAIASDASGLTISGNALYGAVDFCERFLGVRWYFPGPNGWDAPPLRDLTVEPVRYSDEPVFNRRDGARYFIAASLAGEAIAAKYSPLFGCRVGRFTHNAIAQRWRLGGTLPYAGCHSPNPILLAKAYPDKLDVIFHRSPNGKLWYDEKNDLGCYFNVWDTRFADLLVESWKRLDADPKAFAPGTFQGCGRDYVSFGVCDSALPSAETNGIENVYGRFFDYLSHKAAKELPGKKLYLMCYANCAEPPTDGRCRLASNVEIMLCTGHMPSKVTVPSEVEHVRRRFEGWYDVLDGRPPARLWLYSAGHNRFARPVVPEFVARVPKTYGKLLGREELFYDWWGSEEMWHYYYAAYVMYKSMWNPDLDVDAALGELFDRMYPHAAAELKELHRLLVQAHLRVGAPAKGFDAHYPLKLVNRLEALLAAAERKIPADSVEMKRFRLIADYWTEPFAEERGAVVKALPVYDALHAKGTVDWKDAAPMHFLNTTDGTPVAQDPPDVRFAWNEKTLIGRAPTDWRVTVYLAASAGAKPVPFAFENGSLRIPFDRLWTDPPFFHRGFFANVVAKRDIMSFGSALTRGNETNVGAYAVLRLGGQKLKPPRGPARTVSAPKAFSAELTVTKNDPCGDRKARMRFGNGRITYEADFNQYPKGHGVEPRHVFGCRRVTDRGLAPVSGSIVEFGLQRGASSLYMDFPAEDNARYETADEIGWDFRFHADETRVTLRYFVRKDDDRLHYAVFADDPEATVVVRTLRAGSKEEIYTRKTGEPVTGEFE